mmetsp:Transcript_16528/g.7856  ORF Transcript_16528/g.7856 Transcript_16528/m.7856 type:complete len:88 (+) Transcript_16528:253-516(+)
MALNGVHIERVAAIWTRSKGQVSEQEYSAFYELVTSGKSTYFARLHYSVDVPLLVRAVLFVPKFTIERQGLGREDSNVALYSRRVLV